MDESTQFQQFTAATLAADDEQTERLVTQLTANDEPALLRLAQSSNADQRWWAVRALALWTTDLSAPTLLTALQDSDPALRAITALTLGQLYRRAPDVVRPLLEAIADRLTDDDGMVRQAVADALAGCGDDAVPALAQILQGPHEGARTRATYALRKIASLKAAGVLYRHLNDDNYLVRMYAHEGLEELGLLENMLVAP